MKIPLSVRNIYLGQIDTAQRLKKKVDERLRGLKREQWHYVSRVKSLESFALKLESGRVSNPNRMEDLLGCMLVVANKSEIESAENLVLATFKLVERRPQSDRHTHKSSDSFPFDDLRLYVEWRDDPSLPPSGVAGELFEVQIKTFLQHAWTIATHDLVYKADDVSWAKERIAYQIKAMLEHAEVSILETTKLAESKALDKTDKSTALLVETIKVVREVWDPEALPDNLVGSARNILAVIQAVGIDHRRLREILNKETEAGRGAKTLNLSPYGVVIQTLVRHEPDKLREYLAANRKLCRLLITSEIELPKDFSRDQTRNALFLDA